VAIGVVDRLLASIAPSYALRRRTALTILSGARAYDAASKGRRGEGWLAPSSSPNAEIWQAIQTLRFRCRELGRNNPHAARVYQLLPAKIVGKGLTPRITGVSERKKRALAALWAQFSARCDPGGILDWPGVQRLVARTVIEAGEALVQFVPRPGLPVPLQVRVLDPDYVDFSRSEPLDGNNHVVQGVEMTPDGERVAFWLFDNHPGDMLAFRRGGLLSRRVPADEIAQVFCVRYPNQIHGVPWLTPAAARIRDLDDLSDARIVRKKIEACFAAFVRRGVSGAGTALSSQPSLAADGARVEKLRPGLIQYLAEDEDVTFANPSASEGDTDWLILQLHGIAAAIGLTYSQLTGDLRQANYSSLRAGTLDHWSMIDEWQDGMIVHQLCRPVWRWFARAIVSTGLWRGDLPEPIWDRPERPFIDPLKDGQALDESIRAGRRSWTEVVASMSGRDATELLAEIAEERKAADALGVILSTDAKWELKKAAGQPVTTTQNPEAEGGADASAANEPA
jgi:lambda family phage portal protein